MLQPKLKLVIGKPANSNFDGREVREYMEDYIVEATLSDGRRVRQIIPMGAQTDGASIPRSCQWLVGHPFETDFRAGAGGHDETYYKYMLQQWINSQWVWVKVDRATADMFLLAVLELNGVGWIRQQAIYRAVRAFGGGHWDNDAEDKRYLATLAAQITARGQCPANYGLV